VRDRHHRERPFRTPRTVCEAFPNDAVSQITSCRTARPAVLRLSVLLALAAGLLAACETAVNAVKIEPGSLMQPVFVVTDTAGRGFSGVIYGLSVVVCGEERVMWTIAATGSAGVPTRVTYGVPPSGFVNQFGPEPLRAGCYDVFVTNGRRTRFHIDAAGRVTGEGRK
jgi:hypothetical protein